jgi:hypothetical protein
MSVDTTVFSNMAQSCYEQMHVVYHPFAVNSREVDVGGCLLLDACRIYPVDMKVFVSALGAAKVDLLGQNEI